MYAPQTGNAKKNPPLNRPSKYKPPGACTIKIALKYKVKHTLRAVVSPGRTLRFDGKETTASNRLLFHRACAST